jgi:hypothetical protein
MSQDSSSNWIKTLNIVEQRRRLLYLGFVCLPLGVSWMNRSGVQLSIWGCPLVKWIGVPCMGWGLTRSFYATARGDMAAAANFHLFGPLLFLGCAIAALHWSIELLRRKPLQTFYVPWVQGQRFWLLGFCLILGYHLTRLVFLYQSGHLHHWMQDSMFGHWVG